MNEGFIPDQGDTGSTWASIWVAGSAKGKEGFWKKMQTGHGIEGWQSEDAYALSAFRCVQCGMVDLYALERPDPKTIMSKT